MWWNTIKLAADHAIELLHSKTGEIVYIYQYADPVGDPDTLYEEDLRRTENVFRCTAIVQRNPSARTLLKFGRKEPVDLLLTFSTRQLANAAQLQTLPSASPTQWTPTGVSLHQGDHLVYTDVLGNTHRYQIVQVGTEVKVPIQYAKDTPVSTPAPPVDYYSPVGAAYTANPSDNSGIPDPTEGKYSVVQDQLSGLLEISVLAVITTTPDVNVSNVVSSEPVFSVLSGSGNTLTLTTSEAVELDGDPRYQLRVTWTANGATTMQPTTISLQDSTHILIVMGNGTPATGTLVTVTYTNQPTIPVITNGVSKATSSGAVEAQPATLTFQY